MTVLDVYLYRLLNTFPLGVLDDAEDVLVNENIIDAEKATQNILRRKRKYYNPHEEEEVEEVRTIIHVHVAQI